jgi:methionyl-tRNA formyltransferase
MHMAEGLDTGDVLLESKIEIEPNETGGSLHDRLAQIAPATLDDAIVRLRDGTASRFPQNEAEATYAPKLERDDGKIDWSEPAELVERKIRAFDPWPGAFTIVRAANGEEQKLKIFRAKLSDNGLLAIEEAQLEGKRRMPFADLLRGHPWLAQSFS